MEASSGEDKKNRIKNEDGSKVDQRQLSPMQMSRVDLPRSGRCAWVKQNERTATKVSLTLLRDKSRPDIITVIAHLNGGDCIG